MILSFAQSYGDLIFIYRAPATHFNFDQLGMVIVGCMVGSMVVQVDINVKDQFLSHRETQVKKIQHCR